MVVAATQVDGLGQEGAANDVELFIDDVHAELPLVLLLQVGIAEREEGRGDQLPASLLPGVGRLGREQIAGDLLLNEAIEGRDPG